MLPTGPVESSCSLRCARSENGNAVRACWRKREIRRSQTRECRRTAGFEPAVVGRNGLVARKDSYLDWLAYNNWWVSTLHPGSGLLVSETEPARVSLAHPLRCYQNLSVSSPVPETSRVSLLPENRRQIPSKFGQVITE